MYIYINLMASKQAQQARNTYANASATFLSRIIEDASV